MAAAQYDILIEQGATFSRTFVWKDSSEVAVDLTGYTARMQIRKTKSGSTVYITATTENDGITLGGDEGTVLVTIPAADTADLEILRGVYDVELIDSEGVVTRLVEGAVEVSREVTR